MLTAADMKRLARLGVTAEALVVIAEIIERTASVTEPSLRRAMTDAERAKKYRQNVKSKNIETAVTKSDGAVTFSPTPPLVEIGKGLENKGIEEGKKEESSNTREPVTDERTAQFEHFWTEFPKRQGSNSKKAAKSKYLSLLRNGIDAVTITEGASRYRQFCDATGKTGTEKVQMVITWLNQAGWETAYDAGSAPMKMTANWEPGEDTLVDLMNRGFTEAELRREHEKFVNHWMGEGCAKADWNPLYVNRMLNVRKWENERRN